MTYINYIKLWHGNHDKASQYPDCKVYAALASGVTEEEIIAIAEEEDPEIREAYECHTASNPRL